MFRSVIVFAVVSLAAVTGCSAMGFTSNPKMLKTQVAFDHECPAEKVNIVDSAELGTGHASFKIEACGKNYRY